MIYNLEQDFMSAYSYVLVPIVMRDVKLDSYLQAC